MASKLETCLLGPFETLTMLALAALNTTFWDMISTCLRLCERWNKILSHSEQKKRSRRRTQNHPVEDIRAALLNILHPAAATLARRWSCMSNTMKNLAAFCSSLLVRIWRKLAGLTAGWKQRFSIGTGRTYESRLRASSGRPPQQFHGATAAGNKWEAKWL